MSVGACNRLLAIALLTILGAGKAYAQNVIRDGPDASHDPIVVRGPLGFVHILDGALIDPGPDGNAIYNGPSGTIEAAPTLQQPSLEISNSTLGGDIRNYGTIATAFVGETIPEYRGVRFDPPLDVPGVAIAGSSIAGGIVNAGTIDSSWGPGISIVGSSVQQGIVNAGQVTGQLFGIRVQQSSITGGFVNTGTIAATYPPGAYPCCVGVSIEANSFSGDFVNSGTIDGFNFDAELAGGVYTGDIVNAATGHIEILLVDPQRLLGNIRNYGSLGYLEIGAPLVMSGNITNRGSLEDVFAVGLRIAGSITNAGQMEKMAITDSAVGGSLVNAGTMDQFLIEGSTVARGIVNYGTVNGSTSVHASGLTAIDLWQNGAPIAIFQKGGVLRGNVHLADRGPDSFHAEGGWIVGSVEGDGNDTFVASPGPGGVTITGSVTGFANIAANQGRTLVRGGIDSPGFVGIGLVSGTPATLELGAGQVSRIGMLAVYGGGTLATDVTASGEAGRVVAKSAYVRGTLELDLQPGSYGATTVYDDVVTAPNLGATPRTTFKRVTTNAPGFTASVSYEDGTADVTLTRTGTAAVAAATPRLASAAAQTTAVSQASDPPGKVGRSLAGRFGSSGPAGVAAAARAQDHAARRSAAGARGGDRAAGRAGHGGDGRHGRG